MLRNMEDRKNGNSFKRRDELLEIERKVRKWWDESRVFEVEASDEPAKDGDKFYGNFPYPYMNGHLHLGHAYTILKVEFAEAYHRLRGANVLLPFGFHLHRHAWVQMQWSHYVEEFSADATRFSLADAGDAMDDANFVSKTANDAILWLTKEKKWMEEILADKSSNYRVGPPCTFAERVFANKINYAIKMTEKHYNEYKFREALKTGFHELQTARNDYISLCRTSGMNSELLWRFMDIQTRLIAPICPHYAEYVWRKLLKKEGFVIKAGWPEAENHDLILEEAYEYLKGSISNFRKLIAKQVSGSISGSKKGSVDKTSTKSKPTTGLIYVKEDYEGWKKECVNILFDKFNSENRKFAPDEEILKALEQSLICQEGNLNETKWHCMPFIKFTKDQASKLGAAALDHKLPFGEIDVLQENLEFIKRELGLEHVEILPVTDPNAVIKAGSYASILDQTAPSPGSPIAIFFS